MFSNRSKQEEGKEGEVLEDGHCEGSLTLRSSFANEKDDSK